MTNNVELHKGNGKKVEKERKLFSLHEMYLLKCIRVIYLFVCFLCVTKELYIVIVYLLK